MRSRRTIQRLAIAAVAPVILALAGPAPVRAATLSAQQAASVARIRAIQTRVTILAETSKAIATRLEVTKIRLASLRTALDTAETAYAKQQTTFDQRLVSIYKNGSAFTFSLLASSRDLNTFMVRMHLLAQIADADQRTLVGLRDQKITIAQAKDNMEQIETEQTQLLDLQSRQVSELKVQLKAERRLLARISAKIRAIIAAQRRAAALAAKAARRPNKGLSTSIASIWVTVEGYPGQRFLTAYDNPRAYKATGAKQNGISSWYGNEFNGRPTSSGEMFNENDFTAAHRTLPFGTYLAVIYEGRGVIVRITDRGPFISGRILDLSKRAAQELGIDGLGYVRTEIVSPR